jgi:hypothetical protein
MKTIQFNSMKTLMLPNLKEKNNVSNLNQFNWIWIWIDSIKFEFHSMYLNSILGVFSHQQRGKKQSKNCQIHILSFHCVAKNIEWLSKSCTLFLVYSQLLAKSSLGWSPFFFTSSNGWLSLWQQAIIPF